LRQSVLPCPCVSAIRVNTDGQVPHQRQVPGAAAQLLIEQPLKPFVEQYQGMLLNLKLRYCLAGRMPVLFRPAMPAGLVAFG
jgi:hypothetical protein